MMTLRLACAECIEETRKREPKNGERAIDVPLPVSQLSDSSVYDVTCPKGHRTTVFVRNLKFELLFEMGLNALTDGYPREAVSSFVSALERFYEFYWRVAVEHLGVDGAAADQAWKPLSRLSERQLGAYVSASLMLLKKPPTLLTNKQVEFRNNVIHNGYVPTHDEAVSFGDAVMSLIRAAIADLRATATSALPATYEKLVDASHANAKVPKRRLSLGVNILCAVDVLNPPKASEPRHGAVATQAERIVRERKPHGMVMMSPDDPRATPPA